MARLAQRFGFDADEVWNDESNRELREQRESPNVLAPGDVLHIPEESERSGAGLSKGASNRYRGTLASTSVRVVVHRLGEVLRSEPCEVLIGDPPQQTTTDGDGVLAIDVPQHLEEVMVRFPDRGFQMALRLGHLDPLDTESGVIGRLENLGYLLPRQLLEGGHADLNTPAIRERRLRRAVEAFQRSRDLEPTGEVDDATREALREEHGA